MKQTNHLSENGYSFIQGKYYLSLVTNQDITREMYNYNLKVLKDAFLNLKLDPYSPGNRYRSYVQCEIDDEGELAFGNFDPYLQTKEFNPDTGGIVRNYPMIAEEVLKNPVFNMLLKDDIQFVTQYGEIGLPRDTLIWIHLFRYKATEETPAFSSPVWLHKDDEDVVFVHLIDSSKNMIGGDSLIATDPKYIERVIKLEEVFDTLVVNHKKYHAVTPVGCKSLSSGDVSTRDVILVTFQKKRGL